MRFLLRIILTAVLAWLGMLILPLTGLVASAIAAFLVALGLHKKVPRSRYRKPKPQFPFSFWGAFIAVLFVWMTWALVLNADNDGIMASRIAGVLKAPGTAPWVLAFLSGAVAGLVAGFAGLAGNWLGDAVRN
ncbi:MAG: hypothetical protein AB8F95_10575 [Bacteroidia bacterium]